jgi:hypothetical protein
MIFLTPYGFNTYSVLLQQLYNWHIDPEFMQDSLPWANIRVMHIAVALFYVRVHEHVPWHLGVYSEFPFTREHVYPVPLGSWVEPENPPAGAFCGRYFCAVRHMTVLHHGRVLRRTDTMLRNVCTEWLLRVRMAAARRLVAPARSAMQARLQTMTS